MANYQAKPPSLNDYIFGAKLGQGTYGSVYKCYGRSGEVVAVKCILKSSLSKSSAENLINEITILKNISDRFIVELLDFRWDDNYIYLIFEYCSGHDLSKFIKSKNGLPESSVKHFLQQIASGFKKLRCHDVAHMDLKPQNILLSRQPSHSCRNVVLKIADFGFSQYLRESDSATSLRGTPLYMAPEILLQHKYDARVDLWSLGIILYECLFGFAPFSSNSFSELAEKIKSSEPITLPRGTHISANCRDLLRKLLQRDPDGRISFDDFFNHPFLDLTHIPSPDSYAMGVRLVKEAVEKDQSNRFDEAFQLYAEGLQYLVPIYYWGDYSDSMNNPQVREALKCRLLEYMNRAEEIKCKCNLLIVDKEFASKIQAGLDHGFDGDELVENGLYREGLEKYKRALDILIPSIVKLSGNDKDVIYNEITLWMNQAEHVKKELEKQNAQGNGSTTKAKKSKSKRRLSFGNQNNLPNFNPNETLMSPNCYIQ